MPRARLDALRDRRVRRIVAYAARHVPFYREWFRREGIDPRHIHCAADLSRLPVLDRDTVRARPSLFIAETPAGRTALSFSTSGSTGTPLEVHHDRRSLLANIAFGERERTLMIQRAGGSFRPRELYVGGESSTFRKVIAFYDENVRLPVQPRRRFVSVTQPIEAIAAIANAERPDVLVGYGGWIDLFFRTIAARGLEIHLPKMVLYMAEALPHGAREHIEGRFGIPVFSRYSAAEAFKIGFFCEHRTGFHLHEDLSLVRIVDANGQALPDGQQGQVVISNLINRASVLLNYPVGDVATLSGAGCRCGRTFRLLSELEGRVEDILPLPGGRFVHPRAVWQVLKEARDILQYQLVQHTAQRFELTLVTTDQGAFDRALKRALPDLQQLLGPDARIDATRRTEFDRGTGAKFRAVRSLCGPRMAG
jgi:phenylacetate-CoA ligase